MSQALMTGTEKLDLMISETHPDAEVAKGKVWEYAEIGKMVMDLIQMDPAYNRPSAMCDNVMRIVLANLSQAPQGCIVVELGAKFMNDKIAKGVQYWLDEVREKALTEVSNHVNSLKIKG